MRKLMYTLALVVIGFTASYAQTGPTGSVRGERQKSTPEQRSEKEATALQTKLNLTADQKTKVQAIALERIKKADEFRVKDDTELKAKMTARKALMKDSQAKLDAVLTPEQRKTLAASRAEMGNKMRERRGPGHQRGIKDGTPPPPANIKMKAPQIY
jgi:protein CpxP